MEQPKPQPTGPARGRARRVKAPRYPRPLTFAPPPVKGQTEFDLTSLPEQDEKGPKHE